MSLPRGFFIIACIVNLSICSAGNATVAVYFEPDTKIVGGIGEVFSIDIVADISDPVVAWGLDLTIANSSIVSFVGDPIIGSDWIFRHAPDGDGLAGVAFPNSVAGHHVVLATLNFSADELGETDLLLSVTAGDLNEGFGLDPVGFANLTFDVGHIFVPESATVVLLSIGGLFVTRRRCYKKW